MWSSARGGRVAVQAVGVAGTPAFSAVTVDGSLQLTGRTQSLLLTLKRVQVLHIPWRKSFSVKYYLLEQILLKLDIQNGLHFIL